MEKKLPRGSGGTLEKDGGHVYSVVTSISGEGKVGQAGKRHKKVHYVKRDIRNLPWRNFAWKPRQGGLPVTPLPGGEFPCTRTSRLHVAANEGTLAAGILAVSVPRTVVTNYQQQGIVREPVGLKRIHYSSHGGIHL